MLFSSVIIQTTFVIILAGFVMATALAFGLGCKDIASKYMSDTLSKLQGK